MRIREFIEAINPDVVRNDFHAETTVDSKLGKLKLVAKSTESQMIPQFRVDVYNEQGEDVGYARFVVHSYDDVRRKQPGLLTRLLSRKQKQEPKEEPYLVVGSVSVPSEYRRQGVASEIYKFVHDMGNTIKPSSSQTDKGKALWKGFADKNIVFADEEIDEDWRNWAAGLGAAATMAGLGGGLAYDHAKSKAAVQPQAQTQQSAAPKAKVQSPVAQNKAVSPEQIEQAKKVLSDPDAQLLTKVAAAAGIKGTELAQFLAQCAHESANFSTTKEFGDKNYFKKYDIKFNPAKAKELGNLRPGEGELYKGRGFIQLTGKYNYEKAGKALGLDLVKKPALAERPDIAAKIAVWFWKNRVQPQVDNFNDTAQATKPINAGLKGLQDRHDKFAGMKVAIAKPGALAKTAATAPKVAPKTTPKQAPKTTKLAAAQKPKRSI